MLLIWRDKEKSEVRKRDKVGLSSRFWVDFVPKMQSLCQWRWKLGILSEIVPALLYSLGHLTSLLGFSFSLYYCASDSPPTLGCLWVQWICGAHSNTLSPHHHHLSWLESYFASKSFFNGQIFKYDGGKVKQILLSPFHYTCYILLFTQFNVIFYFLLFTFHRH